MENVLQELQLDLIEVKAYRELQVPCQSGSEDAYFETAIQSLEDAIDDCEFNSCGLSVEKSNKDRNRYRLNKKAREKKLDKTNIKPWKNYNKGSSPDIAAKEKQFKRKLRRIPVGEESFSLKGSGYHHVYEWTWDID